MDLLKLVLDPRNSPALKQLAGNFGLSEDQTRQAVAGMIPALSEGLRRNISSRSGLEEVVRTLSTGRYQPYIDQPESLAGTDALADGNAILGHLLGSKDTSRQLAEHVAASTGLDNGLTKKMLPAVAALLMGTMSKQAVSATHGLSPGAGNRMGLFGLLGGMLDADKDGSVIDDLARLAGKFLR